MTTERFTPTANRVGARRAIGHRSRSIIPLTFLLLAVFAASAQAHTVVATATCKSVTFEWSRFSNYGTGNHGFNTPEWVIVFKPTGGAAITTHGSVSFAGNSYSLTIAIAGGDGTVTASSSWSSSQTRDGNSNSATTVLTIANCPAVPPPVKPPPPVTPPPVTPPLPVDTASRDTAPRDTAPRDTAAPRHLPRHRPVPPATPAERSNVAAAGLRPVAGGRARPRGNRR